MMGAAAACRPEEPLELHWDEVCVLSTTEPATWLATSQSAVI